MTVDKPQGLPGSSETKSRQRSTASPRPAAEPKGPQVDPAAPPKQEIAPEPVQRREPLSLGELAQALRKVNLTFDLFEIQAKISVADDGDVAIHVINQRTGETIRRIPPNEINQFLNNSARDVGKITDTLA